ncbi:MAG: TonB-dependent receptor [Bacteroidales bacterium]|nr:TonB-dependent receptor [Bacteroidales bacterium]
MRSFLLFLSICIPVALPASGTITGLIRDASTLSPLQGAHILIHNGSRGTYSNASGEFRIPSVPAGTYQITATFLGYQQEMKEVVLQDNEEVYLIFSMALSSLMVEEIEITGTRSDQEILNTPMRMERLTQEAILDNPGTGITGILDYISGVNTSSAMGIFDNSTVVSMRGMSGTDQGRTLVLMDGFPINKSDEGSVNWHLINRENVSEIMVTKGPGPARYGSNAMGGVIDIRSRQPEEKIAGGATVDYGTFNTYGFRYSLGGFLPLKKEEKGFLYNLNGFYRKSDGYNGEIPEYLAPEDTFFVDNKLREAQIGLLAGYRFNKQHVVEITGSFFNDKRGRGTQIYEIDGAHEKHDTWQFTLRYQGGVKQWNWEVAGFWFTEGFSRLNESMNEGEYSLYLVKSLRSDKGVKGDLNFIAGRYNTLSAGIDFHLGSVDGQDIYYTSTDLITNAGNMETYAFYLQDELSLAKGKIRLNAGIRLNYALFRNGLFKAEYPSYSIQYLQQYQDTLIPDHSWMDIDPKLSVQYRFGKKNRIYLSFAKGFRAPNLDDLCRTGKKRGGFKIANPALNPENLYNMETGMDLTFLKHFTISPSLYYSIGSGFMYYMATGDSVNLGFKLDPVYQKRNISRVDIAGMDIDLVWTPLDQLSLVANYSFVKSKITRFEQADTLSENDLTGKYLTDVPEHKASAGITWKNRFVNTKVLWKYVGSRWINDLNEPDIYLGYAKFPAYNTFSFRLWHTFFHHLTVALNVDNLFNVKFISEKILLSPGRIITGEITVNF